MLKQFPLQLLEAGTAGDLIFLTSTLVMGAQLLQKLESTSFWVSLYYAWLRLCQDQATRAQQEALGRTNMPTITKKS